MAKAFSEMNEISRALGSLEAKIDAQDQRQTIIMDGIKDVNNSLAVMGSNISAAHRRIDEERRDRTEALDKLSGASFKKSDVVKVVGVVGGASGLTAAACWHGLLSLLGIK